MTAIVRQNINLFNACGLNINFAAESFEDFFEKGNVKHLNELFSRTNWYNFSPLEIHPYLAYYPVNFDRENLIVGTMPPITYLRHPLHHTLINKPSIGGTPEHYFYYGNQGQCWDYFINRNNKLIDINDFLEKNDFSICDIVKVCQRKQNIKYIHNDNKRRRGRRPNAYTPSDIDLHNILLNKELCMGLIKTNPNVKNLYFTSGRIKNINKSNYLNLGDSYFSAFSAFITELLLLKTVIEFSSYGDIENWHLFNFNSIERISNLLGNKILFKIRLNKMNKYNVICLPSPSMDLGVTNQYLFHQWLKYYSSAGYEDFVNEVKLDQIVTKYNTIPSITSFEKPWESFKRDIYQKSLNDWASLAEIQSQKL